MRLDQGHTGQGWSCARSGGLSDAEWAVPWETLHPPQFTFLCGLRGGSRLTDWETVARSVWASRWRGRTSERAEQSGTRAGTFRPQAGIFPRQLSPQALSSSCLALNRPGLPPSHSPVFWLLHSRGVHIQCSAMTNLSLGSCPPLHPTLSLSPPLMPAMALWEKRWGLFPSPGSPLAALKVVGGGRKISC